MRVGNIHQIDSDTILIKFWKLGVSRNLLIQNGIRFHLTEFPREKPKVPPAFCVRLRKFLRFRRLDDIIQPGNDRGVFFVFGDMRLGLELFQAGNIILFQNSDYKILALLRYHVIQGTKIIGVNQRYNIEQFREYQPPTDEQIHNFFQTPAEKTGQKLRAYCPKLFGFHRSDFIAHSLTVAGVDPNMIFEKYVYNKEQIDVFIKEMRKFDEILLSKPEPRPVRVAPKDQQEGENAEAKNDEQNKQKETVDDKEIESKDQQEGEKAEAKNGEQNEQEVPADNRPPIPIPPGFVYSPNPKERMVCGVQLAQWNSKFVTRYDSFDAACDHFWSVKELETAHKEKQKVESVPEKKVNSVKRNFEKKKNQLQTELDSLNKTGELIFKHAEEIEGCRNVLNSYISQHLRWDDIRKATRAYQEAGNEIAQMIDKIEFEKGTFWVLLPDDEGEIHRVEIDLNKTAYANGSSYYDKRGGVQEKLQRTTQKEKEVVRKVDKEAQASKKTFSMNIQERRKTWWFERFHWFITTENYLVLAGRDRIQNDVLYKHYLKKDDIYLHAEIHGAASVIIKNPTSKPVSPISIQQAAEFAVSRSTAWKSNEPCECFWVHAWQVKKNLPGQQQAPTGAFYIVGEKHIITMTMPQMGIGILFHVTEAHVNAHIDERRIKVDEDAEQTEEQEKKVEESAPIQHLSTEQYNEELAFPIQHEEEEKKENPDPQEKEIQSDKFEEEEEELSDSELARIALEEPERADVAQRRLERKAKRNRPKPKPAPLEEGVAEIMENEGMSVDLDVSGINALTGCPKADDEFYAAYPMVAPLSALISFKFRIKFVPGDTKKGKAWPIMLNYFSNMKGIPPTEIGLIKLLPPNDVINQLPFNLRLNLGAGGSQLNKKGKNQGGKKGKNKKKK